MIIFDYPSKKVLRDQTGQPLPYIETSIFGLEYPKDGRLTGANRPIVTTKGHQFFATVTMKDGLITKVR